MKIGLFTDTYFPQMNGVATSVAVLADELRSRGHSVYIFTTSDPRADRASERGRVFRFRGVSAYFLPERKIALLGWRRACAISRELELDLIHVHTEFSLGIIGKRVGRVLGIPVVHTFHTMYEEYLHYIASGRLLKPGIVKRYVRLFCRGVDCIIVPTEKARQTLERYQTGKPLAVIPTGIQLRKFQEDEIDARKLARIRDALGLKHCSPVFVSIGRLAKEKNIEALIRAMPDVAAVHPGARLLLVGGGPMAEPLAALAASLGVGDRVVLAGERPWADIGYYYRCGDAFVSASSSETQGLTYLEAMASGVPVAAKADPCLKNIVRDGKTGYLFARDADLSALLLAIAADPAQTARIARAAEQHVAALSSEAFGRRIESLYCAVSGTAAKERARRAPRIWHSLKRGVLRAGKFRK